MFLRIAGAHRAEQSGIKGGKIPFDPNIFWLVPVGKNREPTENQNTQHVRGGMYYGI